MTEKHTPVANNGVEDNNIVDWDGPNDPMMPMNWTPRKKYMNAVLVSLFALVVNLASTMFAPGAPLLMKDLGITSGTVGSLTVSIYILGFAIGPLILSPLSELYGRLIIYHATNLVFLAFTLGCALSTNVGMFLAFRFLGGCAGSAPMTIGGGTIADIFPQEKRGAIMGLFAMGPLIGPVVGPIAGGFVAQNIGWRWTFWIILILSGIISGIALVVMRETYVPILLARKAASLRKSNNNPALRSKVDRGIPAGRMMSQSIVRPLKLLLLSPIVLLCSLYAAFAFGLIFLLFTTFPAVYSEKYHFKAGVSGLAYLGMGVGFVIGLAIFAATSDRILKAQAAKAAASSKSNRAYEDGQDSDAPKLKPEDRLLMSVYLAPVVPIGFFWYAWSAEEGAHWIVPILGTGLIGIGSLFIMIPIMTYLIDVFGADGAASALAANTVLRSLFGAFLPMAGPAMYDTLGLGWGNSLLGFIGIAFIPIPFLFWKYGESIRQKYPVRL